MSFQYHEQLIRHRNFPFFVGFRCPVELRLPAHLNDVGVEADIVPGDVHCFLLTKTAHQKEIVERAVVRRANGMELRQFLFLVDRDLLLNEAGMVVLADQFRHALRLQEGKHVGELVMHGARRKLLRIAEEGCQAKKIFFRSTSSRNLLPQDS